MAARPPHAKQVGPFALAWSGSLPFFSSSLPPIVYLPLLMHIHTALRRAAAPPPLKEGKRRRADPSRWMNLLSSSASSSSSSIHGPEMQIIFRWKRERREEAEPSWKRDRIRGRGMVYGTAAALFLGANGVPFCKALKVVRPPCIFSITYKWAPPPPSSSISRLPINLNEISGSWLGREGKERGAHSFFASSIPPSPEPELADKPFITILRRPSPPAGSQAKNGTVWAVIAQVLLRPTT